MPVHRSIATRLLLASAVALVFPVGAMAAPPGVERSDHEMHDDYDSCGMKCACPEHNRKGDGPDGRYLPPMLRDLNLSETQREKIREVMQTQRETMRAGAEARFKTHDELHDLAMSDNYNEARVKELAAASGRAAAEKAEQRASTAHQIYQLLTPEQRKQMEERRKARKEQNRPDSDWGDSKR